MELHRSKQNSQQLGGRERLIATARDLFTRRGAPKVGINDVTECAGVARMTLYNNLSSKDALTADVDTELAAATSRELHDLQSTERSEEERIFALFDYLNGKAHGAEYRGCPFIHASLQAAEPNGPIFELVHGYKCASLEPIRSRRPNRHLARWRGH